MIIVHREETLQQQDPVDAAGITRLLALGCGIITLVLSGLITFVERTQVANWWIEAVAIGLVVVTGYFNAHAASPYRAPYRRPAYVLVLTLVALCFIADELAQLGANRIIHDDWGLVIIPFYLFTLSIVRPARDVLIGGLVLTAIVGLVAFLSSPFISVQAAPFARILVAMSSILPATLGAWLFTRSVLRAIRAVAAEDVPRTVEQESVRLSVQQENIAQLDAEVVPLMSEIIAGGEFTQQHVARARSLATSLRGALVADLDQDWLSESGFSVVDPHGYAGRMTLEQRTTIRGLVASLPVDRRAPAPSVRIHGQDLSAMFEMEVPLERRAASPQLGAAVLLLRTVFPNVRYAMEPGAVSVHAEFSVS